MNLIRRIGDGYVLRNYFQFGGQIRRVGLSNVGWSWIRRCQLGRLVLVHDINLIESGLEREKKMGLKIAHTSSIFTRRWSTGSIDERSGVIGNNEGSFSVSGEMVETRSGAERSDAKDETLGRLLRSSRARTASSSCSEDTERRWDRRGGSNGMSSGGGESTGTEGSLSSGVPGSE